MCWKIFTKFSLRTAALLLVAGAAVVGARALAHADSSILEYDSQGQLKELREVPGQPTAQPGAPKTSGPNGPRPGARPETRPETRNAFAPETWFEPNEVVVANAPEGFEAAGFRTLEKLHFAALSLDVLRLATPAGMPVPAAVAALRRQFPGVIIDANHQFQTARGESDQSLARTAIGWSGIDAACGEGLRIGMVDTPVDVTHPALAGQKIMYRSFILPTRTPAPADHGTAIAAMLVGKPDPQGFGGLLPGAELLAGNIFTFNDQGAEVADVIAMVKAIDWLSSAHVQAVNLSMAGADNRILHEAVNQASSRGMVLAAAVGNWGTYDRPAFPAAYEQVIGVTAIDSTDAIYSFANRGSYVAFAAPGVQMWTAVPGGGKFQSGTSFAVPYLTSRIAADIAAGGATSADNFRHSLSREAVDLGPPGRDDTFGWGLINKPPRCSRTAAQTRH